MTKRLRRGTVILSDIIVFVFMLTGCVTQKSIPPSEVSKKPERKNVYYFHSEDSVWIVYPVSGQNGLFTGLIVNPAQVRTNRLKSIHIYASPPSAIKIENQTLTCLMENIVKVENLKVNAGMIIASAGVVLLLFALPLFL